MYADTKKIELLGWDVILKICIQIYLLLFIYFNDFAKELQFIIISNSHLFGLSHYAKTALKTAIQAVSRQLLSKKTIQLASRQLPDRMQY